MKISRLYYCFHRSSAQLLMKFQRKTRVCSSVTLGGNNVQRSTSLGCFSASSVVRQIVYKLKNRWKQALGWQRSNYNTNTPHYSYDLRSYCLNFDDAPSNYHIPPHVCWYIYHLLNFSIINDFFSLQFLVIHLHWKLHNCINCSFCLAMWK